MADEGRAEVDKLARLMAVELLVIEMLAVRYLADPDPAAAANTHRLAWRQWLDAPMPFLGEAAPLVAGEVADAIDRLSQIAAERAARPRFRPAS